MSTKKSITLITTTILIASVLFVALPVRPAYAATLVVTNTNDSGTGSLRQAIATASAGDTIIFDASLSGHTISLASTLTLSNSITIDGGGQSIIVSGNNSVQVMVINNGVTTTLNSLTMTHGFTGDNGGGINNSGILTITNSTVSYNTARTSGGSWTEGGGIYNTGALTITNSTLSNNVAKGQDNSLSNGTVIAFGGGIYNTGTLTITNSTFSSNSASNISGSTVNIQSEGGGIYNSGTVTIKNSTFSSNTANANTTGNISSIGGGGIYDVSSNPLTITNSTFYANSTSGTNLDTVLSGGIFKNGGTLTLTNSTFSNNSSTGIAGGIFTGGTLNYANTILANSTSENGTHVDCYHSGAIGTNIQNIVQHSNGCGTPYLTSDPKLGTLQYNGGPAYTYTMAPLAGSPALDAGNDAACAADPVDNLDQRGAPRPYGAHCDIGALELVQYTISGNAGVAGATLNYTGGSTTASDGGNYTITVPYDWSGIVTPSLTGYTFSPPNRNYSATPVTANLTVQGFSATLNTYTLTYNTGTGGTITGTSPQIVNYGSSGTAVTAVPNTGYHFVNWSDSSTANPRTDTSVTANITVTANFAIDTHTLTYTAGTNGTITGTSPQTVNYGASGTAVTAVPNTGYHFVNWSDSSTANPRTDSNVTANITVTANFAIDTHSLTYTAGTGGSITAPATSPTTHNYGDVVTITAVPNTGYHFVNWTGDVSQVANVNTASTSITMNADYSITANFAINT